jgi:Mg-chelatase subunit ChlD
LFADVVLVLDASTSMLERSPDGRPKFTEAVAAARRFVDGMRLRESGASDQVGIVTFNATSRILVELTTSRRLLHEALDGLNAIHENSRIELGVFTSLAHLVGTKHRASNRKIMVVLSDGRANPVPGEEAVQAAEGARAAGIVVYVVGLGREVNKSVLLGMAGGEEHYFFVPDPRDLQHLYVELAATKVPCGPEVYWPRRR